MKKYILIFLALFLMGTYQLSAQGVELRLGAGHHVAKMTFHHSKPVKITSDEGFQVYDSFNWAVGVSAPLNHKNWYLTTEVGFMKSNVFFVASYKYNEGFGEKNMSLATYLVNQRAFLSVNPEYRLQFKSFFGRIKGGLFIASDLSNTLVAKNRMLLPQSGVITGGKLGVGFLFKVKHIGFEMNFDYIKTKKSRLINIHHPEISYDYIMAQFNVVYTLK